MHLVFNNEMLVQLFYCLFLKQQQHETTTGPPSQPTMPPKDQISPFLQIQEAILTTLKNGSASHTFLRTFRPCIEALTGQSAG